MSRDPWEGEVVSPQTFNRWGYVVGNPVSRTDPSGYCPTPRGTKGDVICVDLFIQLETFGGFGFATGDGRGFDSNSDPDKSRAYLYIHLDDDGSIIGSDLHVNTSCTLIGCYGPYLQYENFSATQNPQTGEINVTWSLKNGFSGYLLNQADKIYEAEVEIGGMAIGSTIPIIAASVLPDINGKMTLARRNVCEDSYYVRELNRDPFPSLEIYHYKNGEYYRTIGAFAETDFLGEFAPFWGLNPIAPREIISDGSPDGP